MHAIKNPEAKRWFTLATDPFHDNDIPLAGLPDGFTGDTVVQCVKQKVTISRHPSLTNPTATWGCHIYTAPTMTEFNVKPFENVQTHHCTFASTITADYSVLGLVNYVQCDEQSTNETLPFTGYSAAKQTNQIVTFSPIVVPSEQSMQRIVAGGFEVHNDTSPMHRSGSCTIYSQPQSYSSGQKYTIDPLANTLHGPVMTYRMPPSRPADAALIHDARTWTAEQGCYVPFRLQLQESTAFRPTCTNNFDMRDIDSITGSGQNGFANIPYATPPVAGVWAFHGGTTTNPVGSGKNGWKPCNMDTVGAHFSGLSPESVLTLTVTLYVEIAPNPNNATLVSLASPSAGPDMTVLECYLHCLARLPPGAPVSDNEKGDWWRTVKKVLAASLPAMGVAASAILGNPLPSTIAGSAATVLNALPDGTQKNKIKAKPASKNAKTTGKNPNSGRIPSLTVARKTA